MRTITMLELRQNADSVVKDLRRGLPLTLTYRGQPLARLEPLLPAAGVIPEDDSLYTLGIQEGFADGNGPWAEANAHLTNAEIDRAIYGD